MGHFLFNTPPYKFLNPRIRNSFVRTSDFFIVLSLNFDRMEILMIVFLAIGLSFDSFAVSVCSGLQLPNIRFYQAAKIAIFLALFQAFMPVMGWLIGNSMKSFIEPIDHWLAFGLLTIIGGKMIIESFISTEEREIKNPLLIRVILMLSLATSIDALAVGFSFATFLHKIILAAFIIGLVTFVASMLGILLGKKTGPRCNRYAEIAGGSILILIGLKIMIEHMLLN
jgi:putative Mn2+ efflux pump MntP